MGPSRALEVGCTQGDTEQCSLFYLFGSGTVQDVLSCVFDTCKLGGSGIDILELALRVHAVSWTIWAENRFNFDEAKSWMQGGEKERLDVVPPSGNLLKDMLDRDADPEHD